MTILSRIQSALGIGRKQPDTTSGNADMSREGGMRPDAGVSSDAGPAMPSEAAPSMGGATPEAMPSDPSADAAPDEPGPAGQQSG